MFSIGDFAKHGRVSVRMLRHYDEIGLLRPAHVDPFTGYRSYEGAQLARLNRVIALKDLGLTLAQVGEIIDEKVGVEALRGMLRLRRAELEASIEADRTRLTRVEARLRTIESEGLMPTEDVVVKSVPAVRVAELSGMAGGFDPEHISPVIGPLYEELLRRLEAVGAAPTGWGIAYYDQTDDGVLVHAGLPVGASVTGDFDVVDLPAVAEMATIVHRGPMDSVMPSVQALARWIDANGHRSTGPSRELYLDCPADRAQWVTELQEPIGPA
ncbi:MerR family transcriptional regulator [Umezawaea tangerina]|uniref:DNA-binding transcriptional MerR regulator n=1 Tax=Umezawaea tangerina TaxID=84725 RepID=A0A2T0TAU2_9PSEU|nr:MerR family transcriptional regulator [Umezawaea tangerina]PRY42793.1 DNA-binding transcriptional MerR regulator [Umezawaea tangerina]